MSGLAESQASRKLQHSEKRKMAINMEEGRGFWLIFRVSHPARCYHYHGRSPWLRMIYNCRNITRSNGIKTRQERSSGFEIYKVNRGTDFWKASPEWEAGSETKTKNRDGKGFLLDLCLSVLPFTLHFIFYSIPTNAVSVSWWKLFFVLLKQKRILFLMFPTNCWNKLFRTDSRGLVPAALREVE